MHVQMFVVRRDNGEVVTVIQVCGLGALEEPLSLRVGETSCCVLDVAPLALQTLLTVFHPT